MKTLYLLLLLIIIIITVLICQKMLDSNEGFLAKPKQKNSSSNNQQQPNTCPHGSNSYIDPQTSAINCTKGSVKFNQPDKPGFCTLTPGTGLPPCSEYMAEYNRTMEAKFCFPTLPRYYENTQKLKSNSGCASNVNGDTATPGPGADSCKIYIKEQDNLTREDSCFNKKAEYNFANSAFCKQSQCATAIVTSGKAPAIISSTYTDPGSNRIITCYDRESLIRRAEATFKGEQLQNEINRIKSGQAQEVCGYVPPAPMCNPNKAAKYVTLTGNGYIELSQIVIKDMNGNNIAPKGSVWYATKAWDPAAKPENAIDGTEAAREYPNIYHSIEKGTGFGYDKTGIIIQLAQPTCISEIITYGRLNGCCPDRQANKEIIIVRKDHSRWTSPPTTDKLVQSFKIPASTWK